MARCSEKRMLDTAKSVHADDMRWSARIHLRREEDAKLESKLRKKLGLD